MRRCQGTRHLHNTLSIRRGALEQAVLSVIQHRLLTPEHIEILAAEFEKETRRLSDASEQMATETSTRLREVDRQIETLARNIRVSDASPVLHRMLAELEQERSQLAAVRPLARPISRILPHPTLLERFREKIGDLREALTDEAVRPQAAQLIGELIESVTIYPGERLEAEVSANTVDMIRYAANENDRLWSLGPDCSVMVVAGVGFEPTTFRL